MPAVLISLTAGAIWPLAFAPFALYPIGILSLVVLFRVLDGRSPRGAFTCGYLFGLGMFGTGVSWVFVSIHQFGGLHWTLAGGLTTAMILVLALFIGAFAYVSARWLPERGMLRDLLGLPASWVAFEWIRSWFLTGFPWLSAGYAHTDTWLSGLAPLGGVFMVSLAVAVSAGALSAATRATRGIPVALVVATAVWSGSAVMTRVIWHAPAGEPVTVALLQGNVAQDLKWDADMLVPTLQRYHGMTEAHHDVDLVVWPEAALPALKHELDGYFDGLSRDASARGTAVVAGMLTRDAATGDIHNSVITLGRASGTYHKRHLVPFGEFFPVPAVVRSWLRMMNLPYTDFVRGDRDQAPLVVLGHEVGASICYEAAFAREVMRPLPRAVLLVNVSNDAWFGDSIAPHQHLQKARMRAIEGARWMLRATNTGITAVIGPTGDVTARIPQFEQGVLVVEVQPLGGATPFTRLGDTPVLILIVVMFIIASASLRRGRNAPTL